MSNALARERDRMMPFLAASQESGAVRWVLYALDHLHQRHRVGQYKGEFLQDVLEEVEARSLAQANAMGGRHAFELLAHNEAGEVLATEVFSVTAETLPGASGVGVEPANEGGLVAQSMRHNEALMRTSVAASDKTYRHLERALDSATKRAETAESKMLEMMATLQGVVLADHERQLDLKRAEAKADAMRALSNQVSAVLPDVAGAMVGKLRGSSAQAALTARALFESLRAEQLEALQHVLSPDQLKRVVVLMKALAAEAENPGEEENRAH